MEKIDIESELQDDTIVKRERNKTLGKKFFLGESKGIQR